MTRSRGTRARWLAALVALAGCSNGSGTRSGMGSASVATTTTSSGSANVTSANAIGSTTSGAATAPAASAKPPRIALLPRGVSIDGKARFLMGGEVQYFRIRDAGFDPQKTWLMWEETLDRFKAASLNFVTTYVPWDYHEETEGVFDWKGARDLDRFLEMCWRRDLVVHLKPGPLINSEWPNGVGSFGAAPQWWKDKYPDALARDPNGNPFTVDLLGRRRGRQPSYFASEWRDSTRRFFTEVAPIVRRYVVDRPTIAMIQIDNETNFYFRSRFSSDYSKHGVKQLRAWLGAKYGSIAALNAAYGTSYASFDEVPAPREKPKVAAENLPVQDWFDAGKAGIAEYHRALRGMWESLGIREPDVLFTTNDSPHSMPFMELQHWDAPTKNEAGIAFLDAYPKQSPLTIGRPLDFPFLTPMFAKRFAASNDGYRFAGGPPAKVRACFAAEIQGGIFDIPLGLPFDIPAATTEHVLLDFVGRGGVGGSVYIFRGGLNRDNSSYDFQAAIGTDGSSRPRLDVLRRFGRLATVHGPALLDSEEVEAPVALVVDGRFDAPAAEVGGHPGWIQTKETAAAFGWLEDAGLNPAVIDARVLKKGDLDRFRAVFFMNPDAVHDAVAETLDDYVRRGGTLVSLLGAGTFDGKWRRGGIAERLLARGLYSDGSLVSIYKNQALLPPARVNVQLPGAGAFWLECGPFLGKWSVSAPAEVFAWNRRFLFGSNSDPAGWRARRGRGQAIFLGTNPALAFADASYYDRSRDEILNGRALARWLAPTAPVLEIEGGEARAFARRIGPGAGGGAFVFLSSRVAVAALHRLVVRDLAALGLDPARTYRLEEALTGGSLGSVTGADLARGISVALGPHGAAVIRVY